ncbi:MAG: chemotaxis protein CheA [Enterobacterales bacterium]|nr:chemotaxis protein CheA [Enterobacterales bacterium]
MDPMLESFIQESRDNLEAAAKCFLDLENKPDDQELLNDLFRSIHTMKGSSGLFDIGAFTRVVHAAEDVLDIVREGKYSLTSDDIDLFLDSLDLAGAWIDQLESSEQLPDDADSVGHEIAEKLRGLIGQEIKKSVVKVEDSKQINSHAVTKKDDFDDTPDWITNIDQSQLQKVYKLCVQSDNKIAVIVNYRPDKQCFFNGDDPLLTVLNAVGLHWFSVEKKEDWGELESLDPFQCNINFKLLIAADITEVKQYFRYIIEQVDIFRIEPKQLIRPVGEHSTNDTYQLFVSEGLAALENNDYESLKRLVMPLHEIGNATLFQTACLGWIRTLLESDVQDDSLLKSLIDAVRQGEYLSPSLTLDKPSEQSKTMIEPSNKLSASSINILKTQLKILEMPCPSSLLVGRVLSTQKIMQRLFKTIDGDKKLADLDSVSKQCLATSKCDKLHDFLAECLEQYENNNPSEPSQKQNDISISKDQAKVTAVKAEGKLIERTQDLKSGERSGIKYGRRAGDIVDEVDNTKHQIKTLRVDQERIDSLMDLMGELVVAKNAMPYLAKRAQEEFGVRELAKEIQSQYAVINRLSEELQSTVMGIRMVPVSSVFQRFPRLVRDLSKRLEKNIQLVLEGEETEADKNVIESLADPLIHMVRNSLDHGLETPQERIAAGKNEQGRLTLKATPMDDQVLIEIIDDGKGIDPNIIKQKAYEKGIISEIQLDEISDQAAVNLIFAAGLSSKESASDLSGRGVGMDVVRSAVEDAGGQVSVTSVLGKGTRVGLTLPLTMAVARVMMIDVDQQTYGISMENIRETVRVSADNITRIKHNEAIVLRDKLIPLLRMRDLLGLQTRAKQQTELSILIVEYNGAEIGLIIDNFLEGIDIIQKPLDGVMGAFPIYAGATLLGDGRVLLILNVLELLKCR